MWNPAEQAPIGKDIELAVIDGEGVHALVFPCRRTERGWADARTGVWVFVRPTHWRPWRGTEVVVRPAEATA